MSAWYRDDVYTPLLDETIRIAWNYLERAGEIDDQAETARFLTQKIEFMIGQGQRNRLLLANRAIAAFEHYRQARTTELALVSQ